MTRRRRTENLHVALDAAQASAHARRVAQRDADHRIWLGLASLHDYQVGLGDLATAAWRSVLPTLVVVRAQRDMGIAPGGAAAPQMALARQVLAYQPDERLSPEHSAGLARLDGLLADRTADRSGRVEAALARLMIGSGEGLSRREQAWTCGRAEQESLTALADYECWYVRELVEDWTPWLNKSREILASQGRDAQEADSLKVMIPLQGLATLMYQGLWGEA